MTSHLKFKMYYIKLVGAAKQTVLLPISDIDEIEEFDHESDMRGRTEKRCNVYTKNGEFVVKHSADQIFEMMEVAGENVSNAKIKDLEATRKAMMSPRVAGIIPTEKEPN